ncbi:MAG: acetyl-coenzyme A carboxylase carboxyl transferase subunit alpha [Gammaproteobacteria bacterium]|jgi:acetyl-CoA carboxylase carboxyl transferase subunit alpha|nr:acetyl-CoA carboxylase carboxyltransferase subunit alpha [SAR86 cluster bacterium]MCS5547577.1 acetyl-CoA carboxylase carboxyltransferase subunit alpha [SAR86 cluster bacterium]GIT61775.1 MAG: acetyl-coenzyme A carboxylase carboxyl transferase subunit alpha [Gammaproteobacteria bacterium]|tara:strand:+ start:622 stop:1572 length:951 start_codon:yes stop_codon:yes gene_type:complete
MPNDYLDFEEPIGALENKIQELQSSDETQGEDLKKEISKLNESIIKLTEQIYKNLNVWQCVQVARHPQRPHFIDLVDKICTNFDELHGDRHYGDDKALIGGLAQIGDHRLVLIGHEKGRSTDDKIKRNFGMSQPEGYRKAGRLMKLAEQFNLPVVTLVDTPGAYPGIDSEERGQSEAIANNLLLMSSLRTPLLVNIIGEGGSGGALAIAVGDHISMMKYATYSVASPEACASIVWRDAEKASDAAEAMLMDAESILKLKLIDEIIDEPLGGAHRNPDQAALMLKKSIIDNLDNLRTKPISSLLETRYKRLMSYGHK